MEILAGLAAAASRFAVMHAYEALAHLRATRQPVSHGKLKAKSSLLKISHQLSEIHKIKGNISSDCSRRSRQAHKDQWA